MRIVVNGKEYDAPRVLLRYEDVVQLAFQDAPVRDGLTITYRGALGSKPEGVLERALHKFVAPKNGTEFNVTDAEAV